jgi:hypothetical protein
MKEFFKKNFLKYFFKAMHLLSFSPPEMRTQQSLDGERIHMVPSYSFQQICYFELSYWQLNRYLLGKTGSAIKEKIY